MATYNCNCSAYLIILLAALSMPNNQVNGGKYHDESKTVEGTVKTIKTEDGETIDCVDIYKQPALSHPLLKNHEIQLEPSLSSSDLKTNEGYVKEIVASWAKHGGCPNGSVPIKRNPHYHHVLRKLAKLRHRRYLSSLTNNGVHEYAMAYERHDRPDIRGAQAKFNVWNPRVSTSGNPEYSIAQLWLEAGSGTQLNTLEAGWMVYPDLYNHTRSVFFSFQTNDGYRSGTECYNLACEGFIRYSQHVAPGDVIPRVSILNGPQYEIDIKIYQLLGTRGQVNWWLEYEGARLGYWPGELFPNLANGAKNVAWGGDVYDSCSQTHHTTTQMGNGHFPLAGYRLASYISNLKYQNTNNTWVVPSSLAMRVTNPHCYDIDIRYLPQQSGVQFFYGGPGYLPPLCD